jgi:hypothetical protein
LRLTVPNSEFPFCGCRSNMYFHFLLQILWIYSRLCLIKSPPHPYYQAKRPRLRMHVPAGPTAPHSCTTAALQLHHSCTIAALQLYHSVMHSYTLATPQLQYSCTSTAFWLHCPTAVVYCSCTSIYTVCSCTRLNDSCTTAVLRLHALLPHCCITDAV